MIGSKAIDYIVSEVRRKLALQNAGVPQTRTMSIVFANDLGLKRREVGYVLLRFLTPEERSQWNKIPLHYDSIPRCQTKGKKFLVVIEYARNCLAEIRQGKRSKVPTLDFVGKKLGISRERVRQFLADPKGLTDSEREEWKRYRPDPAVSDLLPNSLRRRKERESKVRRLSRYVRLLVRLFDSGRIKRLPYITVIARKLGVHQQNCYIDMRRYLEPDKMIYWSKSFLGNRLSGYLSEEARKFRAGEIESLPSQKVVAKEFGVSEGCVHQSVSSKLSPEDRSVWLRHFRRE